MNDMINFSFVVPLSVFCCNRNDSSFSESVAVYEDELSDYRRLNSAYTNAHNDWLRVQGI